MPKKIPPISWMDQEHRQGLSYSQHILKWFYEYTLSHEGRGTGWPWASFLSALLALQCQGNENRIASFLLSLLSSLPAATLIHH